MRTSLRRVLAALVVIALVGCGDENGFGRDGTPRVMDPDIETSETEAEEGHDSRTLRIPEGGAASGDGIITVTARTGNLTGTARVDVVGERSGPGMAQRLDLLVSSPQMASSPSGRVTLRATAKDRANNLLPDVPVSFTATSGAIIAAPSSVTGRDGSIEVGLVPNGDAANRMIEVTARAGDLEDSVTVNVEGTRIALDGAGQATAGEAVILEAVLRDSDGEPLPGRTLSVRSSAGNRIASPTSFITDAAGRLRFEVTPALGGEDRIVVSGLGATTRHRLVVGADQLAIQTPAGGTPIELGRCEAVEATWTRNGTPVEAGTLFFHLSRGALFADDGCLTHATEAVTDSSGVARLWLRSESAGAARLSVAALEVEASLEHELGFIATEPASVTIHAGPSRLGPNRDVGADEPEEATVTAMVRDARGHPVPGVAVRFELIDDASGGALVNARAVTGTEGRATTAYVPSAVTSPRDGVRIRAELFGHPAIHATTALTVADEALFVRLGTGNRPTSEDGGLHEMPYAVMVTDAGGNAMGGVTVSLTITPSHPDIHTAYATGALVWSDGLGRWERHVAGLCDNEDANMNGRLDPGEDRNGDDRLTPGNVATVPAEVVTGADGTAKFAVSYFSQYASWVHVRLAARAGVEGTESEDHQDFWLPGDLTHLQNRAEEPPNVLSPFGDQPCP